MCDLLKAKLLIEACEMDLVSRGTNELSSARNAGSLPAAARNPATLNPNVGTDIPWKWSGTDYVKSPTEEPWVTCFWLKIYVYYLLINSVLIKPINNTVFFFVISVVLVKQAILTAT